jgi:hypothetical protein
MIGIFTDLSFSFVMDLFRAKKSAEGRGDKKAIESLNQCYPELFTEEFEEFIENLRQATAYLDSKYGENFSSILESQNSRMIESIN